MKIYYKLLLPFLTFSLLIFLVGYVVAEIGKRELKESVGRNTVYLAEEIMQMFGTELERSIERFEEYGRDLLLKDYLLKSNAEFERLGDARGYMESRERSWKRLSGEETGSFIREVTDNVLAREIREKLEFYSGGGRKNFYEQVFVTNRFGATVAWALKPGNYAHDKEPWWRSARERNECMCHIEYGEQGDRLLLSSAIRVNDEKGNFIGVLKVVLNINRMLADFKKAMVSRGYHSFEYKLVSADGKNLFSDAGHAFREDISGLEFFRKIKEAGGYFLAKGDRSGKGEALYAYSRFTGSDKVRGLGWTFLIEYPADLIESPAAGLKKMLLWVLSTVTLMAVLASYLMSRNISNNIERLGAAATKLGEGDYDARISINSKDEVADLARTFNSMAGRLKEAVESRDLEIAGRKRSEEKILQMAYYDTLTGLPNRTLFIDRLNQVTAWGKRHRRLAAVIFLDLDRFKTINDSFGHDIGDWVLIEVAERLKKTHRAYDTVARFGGDEFMLLLNGIGHRENAVEIIKNILAAMKEPLVRNGQEFFITCSAGISLFPDDGGDAVTLIKNADTAMYRAKDDGKSSYRFFAPEMNAAAVERIRLENRLHRALEDGSFELQYQPQVDAKTKEFVCVEALVRLKGEDGSLISPFEFIPLAEQTGLIVPIGEWVLRTACAQVMAWRERGLKPIRVAVNLSMRQFKDAELVKTISGILKETGLEAKYLELEVTESVIMGDVEDTIRTLTRLKNMGIGLVIDDFGTGYSSLEHLKRLPIYMLKVDQSFVRDIISDPDDAAIAIAIIRVAHSLKLEVIAEGVETMEQYKYLDRLECDKYQGYFFSRPLGSEDVFNVLLRGRASTDG